MKIQPHRFILLAFLVLVGMIVSPVCAATYHSSAFPTYNQTSTYGEYVTDFDLDVSPQGDAIGLIYLYPDQESQVDITLYYGNGSSVSGYAENHREWTLVRTIATVSLGGVTSTYTYGDVNQFHETVFSGYAWDDNTTPNSGFLLASTEYGLLDNNLAAFYPVSPIQQNIIYRVVASSDKAFNIEVVSGDYADVAAAANQSTWTSIQDWIDFAFGLGATLLSYVMMVWGLLLFIGNNWLLILALYISVSMAYSAMSSKNIFVFYQRFLEY